MDFIYLQTFREVAIRESFTRAAEVLGYAQSSVTTQIQKLEKTYQVKLFERYSNNKIRLTSAGEELFKLAGQMLELFEQSKEKLAKQGGGSMTIGTMDSIASYFLPPYMQATRKEYPDLNIRLHTDREEMILHQVREGEADVGLILADDSSNSALQWITIREEPLVLIVHPNHPLIAKERIGLDDLVDAEWIMPEHTCNYRQLLERVLRANGITYRVSLELGNPEAIKRSIKTGEGISILPLMAALEEIEREELKVLPFEHGELKLEIQLVLHPKKWVSNALNFFMESMRM
ncbi:MULTISPECIES: LysR family transcriptional regulator [Paenibacillus]|uniref:LysR family transcriptional regulator n=1 Tax=Paenibacillus TaxID=44249 RepID=UPI00096F7A7F|nr:LysR family transcriptional regulator [Paenibacillus peoriae]OMF68321.1 LysR family transcriptional regulator [Paenibacillus peoriae]OMF81437.1 LysR family transcriptional regulator [Paenibacillus peoriae]